jgi:pimeloyl-ACP methyl ester carboxylesterase
MHLTVNNIRLHVSERAGNGPALVFLHYWGGSSRTWRAVVDALPTRYRIIAPDLRGWGASAAPDTDAYTLADFAADVEQLLTTLEVRQYILIGHSMGGKIAQLLASRRPPRPGGTGAGGALATDAAGAAAGSARCDGKRLHFPGVSRHEHRSHADRKTAERNAT